MGTLTKTGIVSELTNFNDSPLIIAQKILKNISENLSLVFYQNKDTLVLNNEILFQDKSIVLFGFIKLILFKPSEDSKDFELRLRFIGDVNPLTAGIYINIALREQTILYQELVNYCFLMEFFNEKFDDSINIEMINQVSEQIINSIGSGGNCLSSKYWLIPYQNKIERNYDKSEPIKNSNIWNKYSYILRIKIRKAPNQKDVIYYQIWKVYDNNLDKSKSIENLRFLEEDLIVENVLDRNKIFKFVYNLFYYGELLGE